MNLSIFKKRNILILLAIICSVVLFLVIPFNSAKTIPEVNDPLLKTFREEILQGAPVNFQDEDLKSALHYAAIKGDIDFASWLINNNATVNIKDKEGWTPLMHAASSDNIELTKILLSAGTDISIADEYNMTAGDIAVDSGDGRLAIVISLSSIISAESEESFNNNVELFYAVSQSDYEGVVSAIEKKANINLKDYKGYTPLYNAVINRDNAIVDKLLSHGADLSFVYAGSYINDDDKIITINHTILTKACVSESYYDLDIIKSLLLYGADPEQKTDEGKNAYDYALLEEDDEIIAFLDIFQNDETLRKGIALLQAVLKTDQVKVKSLLNEGVEVDFSFQDTSPIELAIQKGELQIVDLLIKSGAKINGVDENYSFLGLAIKQNKADIVSLLLTAGANKEQLDEEDNTPLDLAIESANIKILSLLINAGVNVNTKNQNDVLPIFQAIQSKKIAVVQALVKAEADIKVINRFGKSVLQASFKQKDIFSYLLIKQASVAVENDNGNYFLNQAITVKDINLLEKIIAAGASVNSVDKIGEPILLSSIKKQNLAATKLLLKSGANSNLCIEKRQCPLHVAVLQNNPELIKLLLRNKAEINAINDAGETALHAAADIGSTSLIDLLIENGANPALEDGNGLLAWHHAFFKAHEKVVVKLVDMLEAPARKQQPGQLYNDPRISYWVALYLSDQREKMLSLVEEDLLSTNPHPFSPQVWVGTYFRINQLEQAIKNASTELKNSLGILPDVVLLNSQNKYKEALEKYPLGYKFSKLDVWALMELSRSASSVKQNIDEYAYLEKAILTLPDLYSPIWQIVSETELSRPEIRLRLHKLLKQEKIPSSAVVYLKSALKFHTFGQDDDLVAVNKWLEKHPKDNAAFWRKQGILTKLYYYPEALVAAKKSFVNFPFSSNWSTVLNELIRRGDDEQAVKFANMVHKVRYNNGDQLDPPESAALREVAESHKYTGNRGKARKLIETGMEKWPKAAKWLDLMADLEHADKRYSQAAEFARKSINIDSLNPSSYNSLISSLLKGNKAKQAYEHFLAVRKTDLFQSSYFLSLGKQALKIIEQPKEYENLLKERLDLYPDDFYALKDYAELLWKQGEKDKAIQRLTMLLQRSPNHSGVVKLIGKYYLDHKGKNKTGKHWDILLKQYPWSKALWTWKVDNLEKNKGEENILAVWKLAASKNPNVFWPWEKQLEVYKAKDQWKQAIHVISEFDAQTDKNEVSKADERTKVIDESWVLFSSVKKGNVPIGTVDNALAHLDEYKKMGGNLSKYYRWSEQLLFASNRKKLAEINLYKRSLLEKDSVGLFETSINQYHGELGNSKGLVYGYRMLQRNPYDENINFIFVNKHIYWGGSPIVALKQIEVIKKLGINVYTSSLEKKARSQLGDYISEFQEYLDNSSIGNSDRYIGWFNSARKNVLHKANKEIYYNFNDDQAEVQILQEDGRILVRRDHPIFGKITYLSDGASYIKATYNESGDLATVKTSAGKYINLIYDQNGLIVQMRQDNDEIVDFEYNNLGKPIKISIQEVGEIQVSYDESGEIANVSSDAGNAMALRVTIAFQKLLSVTSIFEDYGRTGQLPSISFEDEIITELENKIEQTEDGAVARRTAKMKYIHYLVDHVQDSKEYFSKAESLLEDIIFPVISSDESNIQDKTEMLEASLLWQQLLHKVKPKGVPVDDFSTQAKILQWLRNEIFLGNTNGFSQTLAQLTKTPLKLLINHHWLQHSDFNNAGFWHRYSNQDIFSKTEFKGIKKQALLKRKNGDLLLGTSKGLFILRHGYWEWFGFDENQGRLSNSMSRLDVENTSSILSLAETQNGDLWIGTANGLIRVSGNSYKTEAKQWQTVQQGLESPRIDYLKSFNEKLLIGTPTGLYEWGGEEITALFKGTIASGVNLLSKHEGSSLLIGSDQGLWLYDGQEINQLSNEVYSSATYISGSHVIFALRNNQIFRFTLNNEDKWTRAFFADKEDLLVSKKVNTLGVVNIPEQGAMLTVLTDMGVGLLRDSHFQFIELPFVEQRNGLTIGADQLTTSDSDDIILTSNDGVYVFEQDSVFQDKSGKVYDLLTDNKLDVTYIAKGNNLQYIDHDQDEIYIQKFSSINATVLALDQQNRLITNDGTQIVRFESGDSSPEELFNTKQNVDLDWWQGQIKNIVVASDNSIWVAAGSSVFHWVDGVTKEFNYAIDPALFPSKSEMISRVYETTEGKIRVIASSEGHLDYKGISLEGGVLQWDGDKFIRTEGGGVFGSWFTTGYTKISDNEAIISSTKGFYKEKNGKRSSLKGIASYADMVKKSPMLWLGGKGSQIGVEEEKTWLLPSAGGVVMYRQGRWLYPDRLNRLLPKDQELGQYGGRYIQALATDNDNTIYVGTDLGLLVYKSSGPASLLINEGHLDQVLVDIESEKRNALSGIFIAGIDSNSEQGLLLKKYKELTNELDSNQQRLDGISDRTVEFENNKTNTQNLSKELKKKLKAKERARQQLLAKLEKEYYGLFQMLKLDPRELSTLKDDLKTDQVLVQYLPTPNTLYIQVTSNGGVIMKKVNITAKQLDQNVLSVVQYLKSGVSQLDIKGQRGKKVLLSNALLAQSWKDQLPHIQKQLAWLYNQLLRPIEHDIKNAKQVFITPVGTLAYLPFQALIRNIEPKLQYAVERFNIGIIPSMFHFHLISKHRKGFANSSLLLADPDGSLPGAKNEVKAITEILGGQTEELIGDHADLPNIEKNLPNSKIVHFATHGILNSEEPGESYLLLANKKRLNVIDISTMDFEQTDLVVLSACESGIGPKGMEYATMSRAFAHAKVPTVIASLWKVHDKATEKLMKEFYRNKKSDQDNYTAMANAQRFMLKEKDDSLNPAAWAGFVVIGKP